MQSVSQVISQFGKLLLAVLLLSSANLSEAQDSDPDALKLLKQLRETYSIFESMSMDFELLIEDLENNSTESREGTLMLRGESFKLSLDDQVIYCDNERIWTFLPDVCEVQIDNFVQEDGDFISPSTLFDIPEEDYFAILGEGKVEEGRKIQVVELTPLDKELSFHKIKLNVDLGSRRIRSAEILDKNGIHFTYGIDDFKGPANLSAEDLSFKASECGDDLITIDVSR